MGPRAGRSLPFEPMRLPGGRRLRRHALGIVDLTTSRTSAGSDDDLFADLRDSAAGFDESDFEDYVTQRTRTDDSELYRELSTALLAVEAGEADPSLVSFPVTFSAPDSGR